LAGPPNSPPGEFVAEKVKREKGGKWDIGG